MKIINHIENNGCIDAVKILMNTSFDRLIKRVDPKVRTALIQTIESIRNKALNVIT